VSVREADEPVYLIFWPYVLYLPPVLRRQRSCREGTAATRL